ncbi:Crp/Fnr family transcriptional regulator [Fodinibius salsisoli]|uniref:Crp/Fnr family transcriptional regulator n=1 Tax=Fodinibius salsisoli TaxID=2820877 RepID=A0ABT3PPU1_9BACT|nr:Crp/Fnr family transcriptional regulator [Fodinibius salsisoli]MCW9707866.1 Crp/Fnr family transcriptional regulator [Fodinibius salsisoli]
MNITKNITAFFEKHYPEYNHDGLDELSSAFISKKIPKDTIILSESMTDGKLRFLNKGIVREYYLSETKERNINFYLQPNFITDFSSFINASRTKKNQATVTDVELFELDREPFLRLLNSYECAQNMMDEIFQRLLKVREQFEYNRMTKSPEELYQELRIYKPEWLQNIPQYHIASYLGITPETLSRIRSRIS